MVIVIVGAGIAGCMCANELTRHGHQVLLLDKGGKAGGRMATRRMHGAIMDHGAQFLSARHERFQTLVNDWRAAGWVVPWFLDRTDAPRSSPLQRFRGSAGINSPIRELSSFLPIKSKCFVERIDFQTDWTIFSRDVPDDSFHADHLVLTLPVPQILDLLKRSSLCLCDEVMKKLAKVRYTRCLALLGVLQEVSTLAHPGFLASPHSEIDWLCDNFHKGISEKPSFSVHSSDAFARKHWDSSDQQVFDLLRLPVEGLLSAGITEWALHRWKFAKPIVTYGAPFLHDSQRKLTLAGDGFGGGSVERSALSGLQAADGILAES